MCCLTMHLLFCAQLQNLITGCCNLSPCFTWPFYICTICPGTSKAIGYLLLTDLSVALVRYQECGYISIHLGQTNCHTLSPIAKTCTFFAIYPCVSWPKIDLSCMSFLSVTYSIKQTRKLSLSIVGTLSLSQY